MLDTMTFTKIVGGFCGALLVLLLGKWAAETLYHVGGGHGDVAQAYVIEVADAEPAEAVDEGPVDVMALLASADAAAGERVWGKCRACHKLEDGANGTGPHLYGVVGRPVDAVADYAYSGALEQVADVWTPENLYAFLENPRGYAPGTKMAFAGLRTSEERVNLIAYLDTIGN